MLVKEEEGSSIREIITLYYIYSYPRGGVGGFPFQNGGGGCLGFEDKLVEAAAGSPAMTQDWRSNHSHCSPSPNLLPVGSLCRPLSSPSQPPATA